MNEDSSEVMLGTRPVGTYLALRDRSLLSRTLHPREEGRSHACEPRGKHVFGVIDNGPKDTEIDDRLRPGTGARNTGVH